MASFTAEDDLLQIPATSPCRRDYQLRSRCDTSRPQSPWRPRSTTSIEGVSVLNLSESNSPAFDGSNSESESLPAALQGLERPYCSDPIIGSPSTISSYVGGPRECKGIELLSRKPAVACSFREEEEEASEEEEEDEELDEVRNVPYTSYLSGRDDSNMPPSMSLGSILAMQTSKIKTRNNVNGNLGVNNEKSQSARRFKNGAFYDSDECVDALNRTIEMRKEGCGLNVATHAGASKNRSSGFTVRGASTDGKNKSSDCELPRVTNPFKWEDAPFATRKNLKKPHLRTSSSSLTRSRVNVPKVESMQNNSPDRFCGWSENKTGKVESDRSVKVAEISNINLVPQAAAKRVESLPVASAKAAREEVACSAVPFKWEEAPGKPRLEQKDNTEAIPALQLPPRLAKRNNLRKNSPTSRSLSMSVAPADRTRSSSHNFSASAPDMSSVDKISHNLKKDSQSPSQPSSGTDKSRSTLAAAFCSDPLEKTAKPNEFFSDSQPEPVSQFGSPQYQNADFTSDKSNAWNSVRSPTSTLCGPGSDSLSTPSSCSSKTSLKSPTTVSLSSIMLSGETPEPWSNRDHASPTSRHSSIRQLEYQESSCSGSVGGREEVEISHGRTLLNLSRIVSRRSSSSKPLVSPNSGRDVSISRSVDSNGYSSYGEDHLDSQDSGFSLPPPFKPEEQSEPPTRLPYKMPSTPAQDVAVKTECASAARAAPDLSNCLGFPIFRSKGARSGLLSTQCLWVENPSWDLPNEPSSSTEDGFRSPAYKATLELLSPPPNLLLKKSRSRSLKLWSLNSRPRHQHFFEAICSSLKQSLNMCTMGSATKGQSIVHRDEFAKRHQSIK